MAKLYSLLIFGLFAMSARALSAQVGVRPGDRLVVRILGGPSPFGDTVVVNSAGSVVLQKLGAVTVAGMPLTTLPDSLRERYAAYLRFPTVEVVVLRRIVVNGEVKRPDIYYVDLSMTLPDAIAHAGGITEAANNHVSIRRGNQLIPVDNWQTSHASVADLQSGDQVIMGRRPWIVQNLLPAVSTLVVVASLLVSLRR